MPDTTAGVLTNNLIRRLRDPDAIGIDRDFVRSVLSDSQRMVNGMLRRTKLSVTLTTQPNRVFYPISSIVSPNDVLRIEFVREGDRDLKRTTLRELAHVSTKWHRHVGHKFSQFALPGRDLLVVYPARNVQSSVEVVYTKVTNEFTDDSIECELPDDDMVVASDLAQMLLLMKMRDFPLLDPLLKQFMERNKAIEENATR